jgi:SPP1 gp7 family putative phage head morphogenesis protein
VCGFCDIQNIGKEVDPPTPFDENDFNRFANDVWIGAINTDILPQGIYLKTATYLKDGVDLAPIVDEVLKTDLLNNIYVFSGAKTYQQTKALTSLLAVPEFQSNFYKFKEQAKNIFNVYNEDYLQAEYQTAKASARMGAEWKRIEADADVLPVLKYQTVGDGRVRPTHAALDNIVRPITDAFWKQYYPPNGWRCRCTVTQLAEDDEPLTDLAGFNPPDDVPPLFRMNTGQDGYIFKERGKDKHPYFDISKGDKENAKVNWGLPIPQPPKPAPIIETPKVFKPAITIDEAKTRIESFNIKINANSMKIEHLNKTLEAIETVPINARPTSIFDKAGYEQNFGRKISRKASEFQGMALKTKVFDKNTMSYKFEKVLVINSREFKTPTEITARKIKYNELYSKVKNGNKWYLNEFDGSTHFHEMGHLYDENISTKKEWIEITNKWYNETKADMIKVSKGGDFRGENGSEAFAEAFASYFGNNKQNLPSYVIDYFEKNIK